MHIVTGERILDQKQLPHTDPYSFTRAGQPWLALTWGSDCIIGMAERSQGLTGVTWIFVIVVAMVTWFWFRLHWVANGNFFFACLLAPVTLSATSLFWLVTPHLFSWILMLGCIWFFESSGFHSDFRPRHALGIALGTALWANLHPSFFFVPAVALIYAVGHWLRPLIWNLDQPMEWRRARWHALAAAFALAGSLLNPYGIQLHSHAIQYFAAANLFGHSEPGAARTIVIVTMAALGGVLALGQKKLGHFLLTALLVGAALSKTSLQPVPAILLLPLANGSITDALRRAHDLRPPLRARLSAFLRWSDRLRLIDARFGGLWLAPVAAGLALLWLLIPGIARHTGFPPEQFPVYAAEELRGLPGDARVLAPEAYGGYIIHRYRGERKVFIDGRGQLYGSQFIDRYLRVMEVRPGWREQLQEFGITHALLPRDCALAAALEQAGWNMLYRDDVAVLFAGPHDSVGASAL